MKNAKPQDLAILIHNKLKAGRKLAVLPGVETLEALFECLFYASMCKEESELIRVTVTLIDPGNPDPNPPKFRVPERWSCVPFQKPIPMNPRSLTKLSKAADPGSTSLAAFYDEKGLYVWGMIDQAMHYENFLNYESETGSEQPGIFQVTIGDIGTLHVLFDYELLATLKQNVLVERYLDVMTIGPVSKMLRRNAGVLKAAVREYLQEMHPGEAFADWEDYLNSLWIQTLSRLLLKIQNYQHGGAVLITEEHADLDVKYRISYDRLSQAMIAHAKARIDNEVLEKQVDRELASARRKVSRSLYQRESSAFYRKNGTSAEISGAVSFVASQTCVDGVVLMGQNLTTGGFGTVLRAKGMPRKIFISSSATASAKSLSPADPRHYGTRHRSMIAYCWRHPGSLGLVISQDGEIRAFSKIEDKLIMWENIKTRQYASSRRK